MQIVIDIPEEIYKASQIIDAKYEDVIQIPLEVIKNSTPLPKGHGRLIDADLLKNQFPIWVDNFSSHVVNNTISKAPTIIEVDNEVEK